MFFSITYSSDAEKNKTYRTDLPVSQSKSVFSVYMESMPEGCTTILDSYISTNGRSFGAVDLQIALNLKLFLCEFVSRSQEVFKDKRYE